MVKNFFFLISVAVVTCAQAQVRISDCNTSLPEDIRKDVSEGTQYARKFFQERFERDVLAMGCEDAGPNGFVLSIIVQKLQPRSRTKHQKRVLVGTSGNRITLYYDLAKEVTKKREDIPKTIGAGIVAGLVTHWLEQTEFQWGATDLLFVAAEKPQGFTNEIVKKVREVVDGFH